jgi:outer membrane lipoprotein-sorting protein
MLDALGNKNHMVFKDIKTDQEVDEKIFSFEVPEGVEVIQAPGIEPAPAPEPGPEQ